MALPAAMPIGYDSRLFRIDAIKEGRPWAEQPVIVGYTARASMDYGHPLHEQLHAAYERFDLVEIIGMRFEVVAFDWDLTFTTSRVTFYLTTRGHPWEDRKN